MTDSRHVEVDVDPGDPHNDQMAARARDDLDWHVGSARDMLAKTDSGPCTEAVVTIAVALSTNPETYPPDRLAAMLAVALVRLAVKP